MPGGAAMTRRSLIAMLAGGAAAAVASEELWTPGKKLISIPGVIVAPASWTAIRAASDSKMAEVIKLATLERLKAHIWSTERERMEMRFGGPYRGRVVVVAEYPKHCHFQ